MTECKLGSESCGVVCTSYEGGKLWGEMHAICNKIECSICSQHCNEMIQAERDRIALHKGKEVHDMKNLKQHADNWNCTRRMLH